MSDNVYILGGAQTDFARHWTREGKELVDLIGEVTEQCLESTGVGVDEIDTVHIGNFVGERFQKQGILGGLFVEAVRGLEGKPSVRHEAACAAGSVAGLAAMAELKAGMHQCALVAGVEIMRNVGGMEAQDNLVPAGWAGHEDEGVKFLWPEIFGRVGDEYERRYGLKREHLVALGQQAFESARRNPNAQTRKWVLDDESFSEDASKNPQVAGRIRRHDCSQITDGGAAVILASERFAKAWAARRGTSLDRIPRLMGWGNRTARVSFEGKLEDNRDSKYVFPQTRLAIQDALRRAGLDDWRDLDVVETHDCFTTTFYMAIDHFGLTPPGESWRAIEEGVIGLKGALPFNPSGGLIGCGHPVGATGVRMLLDHWRQLTGNAGDYQVEGAKRSASLNLGGSGTSSVVLVAGVGE